MAEKKWPIIGLEALGMSIEDIFIAVVDKTGTRKPGEKEQRSRRAVAERDLAGEIIEKTAEQKKNADDETEEDGAADSKYYEDYTIKSDTFAGSDSDEDKK